jgi:hypothetical protein
MRKTAQGFCIMLLLACTACGSGNKDSGNEGGQAIDSTVIEKDTNMADTRKDIELSDPEKKAIPGQSKDSVSDENQKK